jgi:hypothetical protein
MTALHMGPLHYEFLTGFVRAKLTDKYPELKAEFGPERSSEREGRNFYHNGYDYVEGTLTSEYDSEKKCFVHKDRRRVTKEEFEDFYKNEIAKKCSIELESIRDKLIREERRKVKEIIRIREMNSHNRNIKRTPSYFCSKYMDKYYVYNGGIHQIVRASKVGLNGIHLKIEKPSGKLTEFTLELSSFDANRKLFMSYEEAKDFLLNTCVEEGLIPRVMKSK